MFNEILNKNVQPALLFIFQGAMVGGIISLIYSVWLMSGRSFSKGVKNNPHLPFPSIIHCLDNISPLKGGSPFNTSVWRNNTHHVHDFFNKSTPFPTKRVWDVSFCNISLEICTLYEYVRARIWCAFYVMSLHFVLHPAIVIDFLYIGFCAISVSHEYEVNLWRITKIYFILLMWSLTLTLFLYLSLNLFMIDR